MGGEEDARRGGWEGEEEGRSEKGGGRRDGVRWREGKVGGG